jgi:drug/metabolite transporter (DMT)-like permease
LKRFPFDGVGIGTVDDFVEVGFHAPYYKTFLPGILNPSILDELNFHLLVFDADRRPENFMASISVMYGLISAITWGAGDFNGGLAAKRSNPYGVVMIAHVISLCLLIVLAFATGDPFPMPKELLWGGAAGICGAVGLVLLYKALASGAMSVAAPISALVAAALPVLVGFFMDGLVSPLTLAGFALALVAVWLISGGSGLAFHHQAFLMPFVAGISFGVFFIFAHFASTVSTLWPLVAVRIVSVTSLFLFSLITRQQWIPARESWLPIFLSSILDTAGNAFYILSAQTGRMDVAAVLGSLYPGSTVALAYFILKERVSGWQMVGILAALAAIVMITV